MRVLFFNHNGDLYGPGRSLLRLAAALCARGHAVAAALPEEGLLAAALRGAGVDVSVLPDLVFLDRAFLRTPRGWAELARRVRRTSAAVPRLIHDFRPDVVHNNVSVLFLTGLLARNRGVPVVQHIREWEERAGFGWTAYCMGLAAVAHRVVAISNYIAGHFPPGLRRRKVRIVHNGIPRAEFDRVGPADVAHFRAAQGWGDGAVAGVIGRINLDRKGQGTFVEAAIRLADRHPAARFVIVGDCFPGKEHYRRTLDARIASAGLEDRIRILPAVDDIALLCKALDVLVMPSRLPEGLGNTTIEAMAAARPVVGTRLGGTLNLIAEGETGLFFEPDDTDGLTAALDRLLGDAVLRRRMGDAGRARFLQHFEFEAFFQKMMTVYAEAMAGTGGRSRA